MKRRGEDGLMALAVTFTSDRFSYSVGMHLMTKITTLNEIMSMIVTGPALPFVIRHGLEYASPIRGSITSLHLDHLVETRHVDLSTAQ